MLSRSSQWYKLTLMTLYLTLPLYIVFQQIHTDVATGRIHAELQDGVTAVEQVITELQDLSGKLRNQSQ